MKRYGFALAAITIFLDQLTKIWALAELWDPPRFHEVTGFFNLVMVWNRGVSFGMFGGLGEIGPWILSALATAIAIGLSVWLWRADTRLIGTALGLIIGGAIGNVIDRIRFGAVVDFLDVHAFGYHWPAFNIADSAITIGVGLLLIDSLFGKREAPR